MTTAVSARTPSRSATSRSATSTDDLHRMCAHALWSDAMCPATAYFWSHLVSRHSNSHLKRRLLHELPECRTPRVYWAVSGNIGLFTVRGTSTKRDVMVDVRTHVSDSKFHERVLTITAEAEDRIRQAVRSTCNLILEHGWRVHRGIFLHAANIAVAISRFAVTTPTITSVRLYGHSLGGACVSMVFAWLRSIGCFDDIQAAVMSSPDFCDVACHNGWLARYDDPAYFRHYYTKGDPLVHRIPRLAGLKCGISATPFVCPMPTLHKSNPVVRVAKRLIAHVMYTADGFVSEGSDTPVPVGCEAAIRVLSSPRYASLLRARDVIKKNE